LPVKRKQGDGYLGDYDIYDMKAMENVFLGLERGVSSKYFRSCLKLLCFLILAVPQLGRLETSEGVHLLEKIEMSDLLFKPDPRLLAEMDHIRELERLTLARWCEDGSSG
jgi:hypothetical protein